MAARRDTTIQDPRHEDPTNYESREAWQRALHRSKMPADAKRYVKQLENTVVDGWDATFEDAWAAIEGHLDRGMPLTDDVLLTYLTEAARQQLGNLDAKSFESAFNGLYVVGREGSYLEGYKEKKGLK